jgi:hypothetical protein
MTASTSRSTGSSRVLHAHDPIENECVTLTEKVDLTKKQFEVLKIVCDTYQKSIPEYMQGAIVEAMKSDIEEGNFCESLLDKLGGDDQKEEKGMSSNSPAFIEDDINSLQF